MDFEFWRGKALKVLTLGFTHSAGRNNKGRICMNHRGGGIKQRFRQIDFSRSIKNISCRVLRIEYDIYRTAYICLVVYANGILMYILAAHGLRKNDLLEAGPQASIKIGNHLPLDFIAEGSIIHNIELNPNVGGQLSRSAGSKSMVLRHSGNFTMVKLRSGEIRYILSNCYATLGIVSHLESIRENKLFKAGQKRWKGYRPHVRGVAMNPIDHPHGGGHGKTSTGRAPVSAYGKLTKGTKTRLKKKKIIFFFSLVIEKSNKF